MGSCYLSIKKIIDLDNIYIWLLVFVFILASGSCIGVVHARYVDLIFLGLSTILFCYSHKKMKAKSLKIILISALLIWFNFFIHYTAAPNLNTYISYTIRLLGAMFFVECFNLEHFEKIFIKLITVVSLIGLIIFVLDQQNLLSSFYSNTGIYPTVFGFNVLKRGEMRNSAIFWEPGAYQIFLNLSILFLLDIWNFDLKSIWKNKKITIIILIVSLLTSRSTTGYLLFAFILVYVYRRITQREKGKSKLITFIFGAVILLLAGAAILQSSTVIDKLSGRLTESLSVRTNDFIYSLKIIKSHLFIGTGLDSELMFSEFNRYRIYNNSSGLLNVMIGFGIIVGVIYVIQMAKNIIKQMGKMKWVVLILIIATGFTETFFYYPIYMIFLFEFSKKYKINP